MKTGADKECSKEPNAHLRRFPKNKMQFRHQTLIGEFLFFRLSATAGVMKGLLRRHWLRVVGHVFLSRIGICKSGKNRAQKHNN
jgi:hypothetical protein